MASYKKSPQGFPTLHQVDYNKQYALVTPLLSHLTESKPRGLNAPQFAAKPWAATLTSNLGKRGFLTYNKC